MERGARVCLMLYDCEDGSVSEINAFQSFSFSLEQDEPSPIGKALKFGKQGQKAADSKKHRLFIQRQGKPAYQEPQKTTSAVQG